jgi:hypothetical protein
VNYRVIAWGSNPRLVIVDLLIHGTLAADLQPVSSYPPAYLGILGILGQIALRICKPIWQIGGGAICQTALRKNLRKSV